MVTQKEVVHFGVQLIESEENDGASGLANDS